MSNSFNISVKPEIASLEAKVDIIDTEVDQIRLDVTDVHDTDLPAVKSDTGPVRNDVTAIHDTMLPSVMTNVAAIRNDVTDIHDVNLPLVKTDTGAIRNDVNDITTLINAIKTKTDATPQKVRGKFYCAYLSTSLTVPTDVVNVSGQGKLLILAIVSTTVDHGIELNLTVDGVAWEPLTHLGDTNAQACVQSANINTGEKLIMLIPQTSQPEPRLFDLEFSSSLLIQIKKYEAGMAYVACRAIYLVDNF